MSGSVRTLAAVAGLGLTGYGGYRYAHLNKAEAPIVSTEKEPKHYDSRPFQLLTKEDIDQRLRANQFVNKSTVKNVKSIHVNQVASNNPVEDNYSVNTFQDGLIAGVYDGKKNNIVNKGVPLLNTMYRPHWTALFAYD
jgi:hypothetical protein